MGYAISELVILWIMRTRPNLVGYQPRNNVAGSHIGPGRGTYAHPLRFMAKQKKIKYRVTTEAERAAVVILCDKCKKPALLSDGAYGTDCWCPRCKRGWEQAA